MIRLSVRVQPGAKADEVVGWIVGAHGSKVLKIRLRAPAVEGKANAALVEFLAEVLGVHHRQLTLERGGHSREKVLRIEGLTEEQVRHQIGH